MSSNHSPPRAGECPLLLSPQDFALDAEQRLGRANGNTYQRRPAVENVHDGQIMVRLKKKRFIIIDYGIVPTPQDLMRANSYPYVVVPEGAGERLCATRNCPRIGVPVQLYDSEPTEPASLYLRGGLCFSCQRHLNEKRRTQRKRKSDCVADVHQSHSSAPPAAEPSRSAHHPQPHHRYRLHGSVLDLNPDAVIINGPIEGTRSRGPDYPYPRIGQDLLHLVAEIHRGSHALLNLAYRMQTSGVVGTPGTIAAVNGAFQTAFRDLSRATYLITQWKASWDENVGANILAASATSAADDEDHEDVAAPATMDEAENHDEQDGLDSDIMGDVVAATAAALASAEQSRKQEERDERQRQEEAERMETSMVPSAPPEKDSRGESVDDGDGNAEKVDYDDLAKYYEEV